MSVAVTASPVPLAIESVVDVALRDPVSVNVRSLVDSGLTKASNRRIQIPQREDAGPTALKRNLPPLYRTRYPPSPYT